MYSYFPRAHPKSRLFQIVNDVPTIGIPKIGWEIRDLWNSRNMDYFSIDADFWNSNYRVYSINFPICWISKIGIFFIILNLCISRSTSYFWNWPIFGIPIIPIIFPLPTSIYWLKTFSKKHRTIPFCKELVGYHNHPLPYFRRNFGGPRSTNYTN